VTRQTFAAGDTVRVAHLEAVARMNAELTALRARVAELEAERARIVAWLLEMSELNTPFGLHAGDWPHAALAEASAAIERGKHWEAQP
jgi:hypothetical protein